MRKGDTQHFHTVAETNAAPS